MTAVESPGAKHPDEMAPLLAQLDELIDLTRAAGRADLTARLGMSRARVADPRVRLVVVGEPKNGMSTLVNGLVGSAVSATDSASLGSFLFDRPLPNSRVRAANVAGTSTTSCSAATSC